ncbi:2-C-methyl-D-erythritol 4-phosphate cytidylyltransferase [Clostridiaceae bacterium]|jgi:2-C-methyl-D-erythritol 4-phosphate cytidylyltransferase|nr:2-C-methyl-D-erythritol 4-phosphate cytidylyltransferase [Clostridiaceae bacterium]
MLFGRKKKEPPRLCVAAVIPAAGSSQRMGGENKLLAELGGVPILIHTLAAFEQCEMVDYIVLVAREEDILVYQDLYKKYGLSKKCILVRGGETRAHSVLEGVRACLDGTDIVAIHDAARPLVTDEVICGAIRAAAEFGGAAPVVPMKDSVKRVSEGKIEADVPRDTIAAVQTPQCFVRGRIEGALVKALRRCLPLTDDCAAFEAAGLPVRATQGDYRNIKITTPEDLLVAEAFLQGRDV